MRIEDAYAALFSRLSTALPDYWATREIIPAAQCQRWPALLVHSTGQVARQTEEQTTPTKWMLLANVALYIARQSTTEPFEPTLHDAIDTVLDALDAQPGERNFGASPHTTLGDLVVRVWIQGEIGVHIEPGNQRAVILIPVEMFTY